jgi:outer membrane protein assembly factor BamD (BamD/ComL family)
MRSLAGLLALLLLSACSAGSRDRTPSWNALVGGQADRLVREADAQLSAGNPAAAIRLLEDVVRQFPEASIHDRALYELARTLVLTGNGGRGYRHASAQLDRLLQEHPTSPYAPDARALWGVLAAYVARAAELDRLLERLRTIDLEFERPRPP